MPSDPSLELQKAIKSRLLGSDDVMDFIEERDVHDVSGRPERMPCINIGEGQTVFGSFGASTCYADLHIWVQESGLKTSKLIANAVVEAVSVDGEIGEILQIDGFVCHDLSVGTRYLRDSHGPFSHAIVSVAAIMKAT